MALITCSECGKEISDQATVCPNCGMPLCSEDRETYELTIHRRRQRFLIYPATKILVDNSETYQVRDSETVKIPISAGQHLLILSMGGEEATAKINISADTELEIALNRITGNIDMIGTSEGQPLHTLVVKHKKAVWYIVVGVVGGVLAALGIVCGIKEGVGAIQELQGEPVASTSEQVPGKKEKEVSKKKPSDKKDDKAEKDKKKEKEEESNPAPFEPATDEEVNAVPDPDGLLDTVGKNGSVAKILIEMGVRDTLDNIKIGNLVNENDVCVLDLKCSTSDDKTLLIGLQYAGFVSQPEWTVIGVRDYDTRHLYYVIEELEEAYDIYDYKTGKLISKATKTNKEVQEEADQKVKESEKKFEESLEKLKKKSKGTES